VALLFGCCGGYFGRFCLYVVRLDKVPVRREIKSIGNNLVVQIRSSFSYLVSFHSCGRRHALGLVRVVVSRA
jgi:hypothetical protein